MLEHIEQQTTLAGRDFLGCRRPWKRLCWLNANWAPYYKGSEAEVRFARKYSLSDRIRYYWPHPQAAAALNKLLANLGSVDIPLTLLSQYLPRQYAKVRTGLLKKEPEALLKDRIAEVYEKYLSATTPA